MPIIEVNLLKGRSADQKRKLVKEMTDAVCRSVDVKPEHVRIIIRDMEHEDFSVAGELHCDKKK